MSCSKPIGVFDSGLGGISVLRAIKNELPQENLIYLADKTNAPYGSKSDAQILQYTRNGAKILLSKGAKAIVIACNTATSVAAEALRKELDVSVIGLEPAIKPAFLKLDNKNSKILVLATPVTLSHIKFIHLLSKLGEESFVSVPAPELVTYIENGMASKAEIISYLKMLFAPYQSICFESCVLGCTHFPFVKNEIAEALGYRPVFFDGAQGAAKELKRQLISKKILADNLRSGRVKWLTKYPNNIQKRLFYSKL